VWESTGHARSSVSSLTTAAAASLKQNGTRHCIVVVRQGFRRAHGRNCLSTIVAGPVFVIGGRQDERLELREQLEAVLARLTDFTAAIARNRARVLDSRRARFASLAHEIAPPRARLPGNQTGRRAHGLRLTDENAVSIL